MGFSEAEREVGQERVVPWGSVHRVVGLECLWDGRDLGETPGPLGWGWAVSTPGPGHTRTLKSSPEAGVWVGGGGPFSPRGVVARLHLPGGVSGSGSL